MPITVEDCKEYYSKAYVRAVAAAAGYAVNQPEFDKDSRDLVIHASGASGTLQRPALDVQTKCTEHEFDLTEQSIPFDLDAGNYNDLVATEVQNHIILVVVFVPSGRHNWLRHSEQELAMSRCGYWMSLHGLTPTSNTATHRVQLPRRQQFTVDALQGIMSRIANRQLP